MATVTNAQGGAAPREQAGPSSRSPAGSSRSRALSSKASTAATPTGTTPTAHPSPPASERVTTAEKNIALANTAGEHGSRVVPRSRSEDHRGMRVKTAHNAAARTRSKRHSRSERRLPLHDGHPRGDYGRQRHEAPAIPRGQEENRRQIEHMNQQLQRETVPGQPAPVPLRTASSPMNRTVTAATAAVRPPSGIHPSATRAHGCRRQHDRQTPLRAIPPRRPARRRPTPLR